MPLKLRQHRHQMGHFRRALCRGQQEQDRVEIAFFRHNAVLTQVVRQNRRRNTKLRVLTCLRIDSRRGQQQLAGINKILILGVAIKTMPTGPRLKAEETTLTGDHFGRMILPRAAGDIRRHKRLDHLAVGDDRFTRFDAHFHTLSPQTAAALALMDFGVHIECGKQRVKRAGRGVQHKGIVQALMWAKTGLAAQMVILFMDLRGLRESGLLFVHGLGNEDPRIVFVQLQQQR